MDSAQKYFWGIFTIVCAGSVIYCYNVVPGTPIFAALSGASIVEIARLRHITTFDFPGNVYVRNLIMDIATPFVSYVAYGYYRTYKTRRAKCWLALSIALALFSLLYTGEIKPVAVYVVGFIILRGIINEGLSKSLLLYSLLSGVLVIGLLTYLTDGVVDISFYGGPLSRLTMIQSFGVALSFDVFPEMHNFLYGGSFPDWMTWLLGVEHEKTGRLLMEIHNPEGVEAGTVGVVASLFVADAYANFGMAGLFLSPLVVGFILQALHSYIAGLPKTPVSISLMVYCMFRLPIISSFTGIIWNVSLIFVVVCVTASVMWRRVMLPPYK
jgi:oligosaccharide repeat unit polymerase